MHDWLVVRGFRGTVDGDLRKRVGSTRGTASRRTPAAAASYDVASDPGGQAPGREEEGGYVNVEDHRYCGSPGHRHLEPVLRGAR